MKLRLKLKRDMESELELVMELKLELQTALETYESESVARHRRVFWLGLLCMRGNKHKGGSVVVAAAGTTTATAATLPHATNANLTLKNTRRKERERRRSIASSVR